jgi:hypothetical protein
VRDHELIRSLLPRRLGCGKRILRLLEVARGNQVLGALRRIALELLPGEEQPGLGRFERGPGGGLATTCPL